MNRMFPERSYGKFVCCDGINHAWFMPCVKTLIHYLKTTFWDRELKLDLSKLMQKPTFPQRSFQPKITWLGHSTFLIQVAGKNILTDPIFGALSSIFRRLIPSVVKVQDLPPIDYVLLSHNHYDHMDSKSLCELRDRFPQMRVLVPMGDKAWFDFRMFKNTSEHTWWDEIYDEQDTNLKYTFLPANHWSQRTLFDKNKSLWGSWMIQTPDITIYFGGDTSWGLHFKQIGKAFEKIDIALLPIAPGEPRSLVKDTHINAQEAVQAFIDLNADTFVPMHWGTFHLGFDDYFGPIELLNTSWNAMKAKLAHKELAIVKVGQLMNNVSRKLTHTMDIKSKQISV